jgi:hypothetical protein
MAIAYPSGVQRYALVLTRKYQTSTKDSPVACIKKNVTIIRMIIICGAPSCGTTYDHHLTIRVVIYAPGVVNDAPRVINCAPREHL